MGLVGALGGLVERGRQLGGAWLLLVALGGLVEMRTQAVDAGGARGERLLVLRLGHALGHLLRVTLALWNALLPFYGLVSLRAVVVYCQRLLVSRTRTSIGPTPSLTRRIRRQLAGSRVGGRVRAIRLFGEYRRHRRFGRARSCRMERAGRRRRCSEGQLRITTAIATGP